MGIQIEHGNIENIDRKAFRISDLLEKSHVRDPMNQYRKRSAERKIREKQIRDALDIIDEFDAWDVEIEVD